MEKEQSIQCTTDNTTVLETMKHEACDREKTNSIDKNLTKEGKAAVHTVQTVSFEQMGDHKVFRYEEKALSIQFNKTDGRNIRGTEGSI